LDSDDDDAGSEVKRLRPVSALELPPEVPVRMANLCAVRFRPSGMIYELDCGSQSYTVGDLVLCESDRGQRIGRIEALPRPRPAMSQRRRVLRKARPDEGGGFGDSQQHEVEAYRFCKARLRELGLPMKLLSVEVQSGQRATFFFASEDRVDFRDLVRDLSQRLRLRVEMRQVGARDGAKAVGGIGSCGRELCCSTFLPAFQPISIRMAKDQGMVLNPSKLAGQCGRLKCCLIYEHSTYKELGKTLPKVGKKVITPEGIGRVLDLDILKQRVRVYLEEGGAKSFAAAEVRSASAPQGQSAQTPEPHGPDEAEN
jgi:cell fate regulator YaaT (PSP1 superfamily)